jgi:hypothetical protein
MVSSSAITITVDGECLSRDGFLLGETIRFGSLEFIIECFGGVNLSPQRDGSDVAAMGSTHCGPLSPLWAMTGDSILEFYTVLDGEGGSASPLLEGMARGLRPPPRHNHVMAGEHSDHSGDDDDTTVADGTMAGHWPPFQEMTCSSGREMSTSPRPVTLRRAGDSATA